MEREDTAGPSTWDGSYKWKPVKTWHWRYWFGWRWRSSTGGYDPSWEYQTNGQRARENLKEKFDK